MLNKSKFGGGGVSNNCTNFALDFDYASVFVIH
jgi:hypothetical protein